MNVLFLAGISGGRDQVSNISPMTGSAERRLKQRSFCLASRLGIAVSAARTPGSLFGRDRSRPGQSPQKRIPSTAAPSTASATSGQADGRTVHESAEELNLVTVASELMLNEAGDVRLFVAVQGMR